MFLNKKLQKLETGQSMMEYWPTIPAAIMIIISAGLVVTFLRGAFSETADVLNRSSAGISLEICESGSDSVMDSTEIGDDVVELVSSHFDGENTTVVYRIDSALDPDCVKENCNNGVGNGVDCQPPGAPPENDGEGTGPGNPGNKGGANKDAETTDDFSWLSQPTTTVSFDLPDELGDSIVDSSGGTWVNGVLTFNTEFGVENNVCTKTHDNCNNGVGNGVDCQPPGDPKENDGEGTSAGDPGNKGGGKNTIMSRQVTNLYLLQDTSSTAYALSDGQTTEIFLVLAGQYDFEPVTVTTSNGSSTILAPVTVIDLGHTETIITQGCDE